MPKNSAATAAAVSTVFHLGLMLVLSMFYLSFGAGPPAILVGAFSGSHAELAPLPAELTMPTVLDPPPQESAANDLGIAAQAEAAPIVEVASTRAFDLFGPAADARTSIGDATGVTDMSGPPRYAGPGAGMFGDTAAAESLAYVVDASGSMEGSRMQRVLHELAESIQGLREDQTFFVVFFNNRTYPMMWPQVERSLLLANPQNKARVIQWTQRVVPAETTMPQIALKTALELRPDLVMFLTDGEIPESTTRIVRLHRQYRTRVDSIGIGPVADNPLMRKIAHIGHGEFRVAP